LFFFVFMPRTVTVWLGYESNYELLG